MQEEPASLTILLVEDSNAEAQWSENAFAISSYDANVIRAKNGAKAIECLENPIINKPDLIFLDLRMPIMDGFEFLDWLRQHVEYKTIIVLVFTSSEFEDDIFEAYSRYANCYVIKPKSIAEYNAKVQEVLDFWTKTCRRPS